MCIFKYLRSYSWQNYNILGLSQKMLHSWHKLIHKLIHNISSSTKTFWQILKMSPDKIVPTLALYSLDHLIAKLPNCLFIYGVISPELPIQFP